MDGALLTNGAVTAQHGAIAAPAASRKISVYQNKDALDLERLELRTRACADAAVMIDWVGTGER